MKTCKKLLAITIALVLLVSTLVSGLVVSAADANTLVIGTTEIVKGTATADVQFVLTFAEATKAPHSLCTITAAEGLTLSELKIDAVDYVSIGDTPVEDDELIDADAEVTINNDGKNIAAGKVLFESAVDSKAPTVNSITFTATFAVAADAAVGDYAVNAEIDATNYDEADYTIAVTAGKVSVVEPPVVEPECDHANVTFVSATGATANAKGSINFTCDDCGEPVVKDVEYNAYNTVASFSAACESEILLQYDVWTSLFTAGSDISTAMLVIDRVDYSSEEPTTVTKVLYPEDAVEFTAQSKPAYRWSYGIAAMMLNDTCTATVYCQANGVWYSGLVNTKTFAGYAKDNIKGTDAAMDTLFVDLLNYGAAAQVQFGYNEDNLANAILTDDQKALATPTDPEAIDVKATEYTLASGHYIPASYSLMCESRIMIRYSFMAYGFTVVPEDVRLEFSYTDYKGNPCVYDFEYYDALVAEGNTDKIAAGEYFTIGSDGRIYVDFAKLTAADGDATVVAKLYVGDSAEYDVSVTYSVASYVNAARAQSYADLALTNALYKYCKSANVKFG